MKQCKFDYTNSKNERVSFTYSFDPVKVDTGFVLQFAKEGNEVATEADAKKAVHELRERGALTEANFTHIRTNYLNLARDISEQTKFFRHQQKFQQF